MRYYVIGQDGQKYGPADLNTLNQWINEGRLVPNQMLEDETSGARIAANAVTGLTFPIQGAQQGVQPGPEGFQPGQPYQNHYARPGMAMGDDGSRDVQAAWIWSIASVVTCWLCCTPVLAIPAFLSVRKAEQKGNPGAKGPKIVAIVGLLIWAGYMAYSVIGGIAAFNAGQFR